MLAPVSPTTATPLPCSVPVALPTSGSVNASTWHLGHRFAGSQGFGPSTLNRRRSRSEPCWPVQGCDAAPARSSHLLMRSGIGTGDFPEPIKEDRVKEMKLVTTLERDEEGVWVAECPSIPGCVSQGDTRDEALANIREAIAVCLEVRAERGLPLTIETQQVEVAL